MRDLSSSVIGTREKRSTLFTAPIELMDISGRRRYLPGNLPYSIEEAGQTSISPLLSIPFSLAGTPLIKE
jgi:hypothetical protein